MVVADAGYKTPAIAHRLLEDGIEPLFPYTCPKTKDGFFRKHEFVYDEYNDCYICPESHVLAYSTTNRNGYKEYKSCGEQTKDGFFRKHEFVYDEYNDCYICPESHVLAYSTTNRNGYKEYKSCGELCAECQYLPICTESKNHENLITRHVWEEYMETSEDIRHTIGNKQIYQ